MSVIHVGDFTVTHQTNFRDTSGRFEAALKEGCEDAAEDMADQGAALAIVNIAQSLKVRTGALISSVDYHMAGPHTGEFYAGGPGAEHAAPLEEGARPHDIPNSFGWGPDYGFGHNVGRPTFHPGNPAFRFMAQAGRQLGAISSGIVAKHLPKG